MAKRKRKRRNPTGLETGLLTAGGVLIGGIGGFVTASYICGRLLAALPPPPLTPGTLV